MAHPVAEGPSETIVSEEESVVVTSAATVHVATTPTKVRTKNVERVLEFSFVRNKKALPEDADCVWAELIPSLSDVKVVACTRATCTKHDCDHKNTLAWCGSRFKIAPRDGKLHREAGLAIKTSVFAFDVDWVTQETLDALIARLGSNNPEGLELAAIIHPTHSDGRPPEKIRSGEMKGGPRSVRVVLRPSRDILPSEWRAVFTGAQKLLGVDLGPGPGGAKDLSRLFFLPTRPSDVEVGEVIVLDGYDLDVEECLELGRSIVGVTGAFDAASAGTWTDGQPLSDRQYEALLEDLKKARPSIEGQNGGFHACAIGALVFNDWNCTWEQGWKAVLEWNKTCVPPWTPEQYDDLEGKLHRGAAAAINELDCKRQLFAMMSGFRSGLRERYSKELAALPASDSEEESEPATVDGEFVVDPLSAQLSTSLARAEVFAQVQDEVEDARRTEASSDGSGPGRRKKLVYLSADLERMSDEGQKFMADDPDESRRLYQRGDTLVQVTGDGRKNAQGDPIKPRIKVATVTDIQARVGVSSRWIKTHEAKGNKEPREEDVMVPRIVAERILSSGTWGVQNLINISDRPVMRPDGVLVVRRGFDPATGIYLAPSPGLENLWVPERPTLEDARRAYEVLASPFMEFPFIDKTDLSSRFLAATLSLLLTIACRSAIPGTCPFFSAEAPQPSSGKTLLIDVISLIVTGRTAARRTMRDEIEEPKRIFSTLLAGKSLALIDNVARSLGSEHWDALATAMTWEDRVLGVSEEREVPATCIWTFTGNNLDFINDMKERVLRIMLNARVADPGSRTFTIDLSKNAVLARRAELLGAAFTIMSAYLQMPKNERPPVRNPDGKFPDWNATVRGAIEMASGVDPWIVEEHVKGKAVDVLAEPHRALLLAWFGVFGNTAKTTKQALAETAPRLRNVLEAVCAGKDGRVTAMTIGKKLSKLNHTTFRDEDGISISFEVGPMVDGSNTWRAYPTDGKK